MKSNRFRLLIVFALIIGLLNAALIAQAATSNFSGTLRLSDPTFAGQWCSVPATHYNVIGPVTVTATDTYTYADQFNTIDVALSVYSPSFNPANPTNNKVGGTIDDVGNLNLAVGTTYYLVIEPNCFVTGDNPWEFTLTGAGDVNVGAVTTTTTSVVFYPPDNRINWRFGDLGAVLYRGVDSTGNSAINVYCYDGSNAWHGLQANDATASGTSANGCAVNFYILPEGGYQFNINYDGKRYEIECADFDCRPPVMRYFDPNE
jgi:hypothetical protein